MTDYYSADTYASYKPESLDAVKTIPLTIDGVDSGTVNIIRNSVTGIVTLTPYLPHTGVNLSNTYFFEKDITTPGDNPFVFLIDVTLDAYTDPQLGSQTLDQYLTAKSASTAFKDLQIVRDHLVKGIFTKLNSPVPITLDEFNTITKVRMVPWTGDFTCVIADNPYTV